ncbi:DNA polymerase III beta subunit [Candidatus Phytoplasma australiense]|uniref:Beta sliding clamp n=1 Tax=Phytoplasma australiense TaxID=59748 RepID=B1V9D6_PHYAS|nr:DNA polymerase III beta subunit [Candidatus Phytoplasma australiense]
MYLEINKDVFLKQLLKIYKILPQKSLFPVFNILKITAKKNTLILEVNNGNIAIQISIEDQSLKIEKEGEIACFGRHFIEIIKKINTLSIKMTVTENNFLVIKTNFCEYKLKLMTLLGFLLPEFFFEKKEFFELKVSSFKKMIKEVNISSSKNEKRPILTGSNLIYEKKTLKALATDSFRISYKKIKLDFPYFDFNMVIPNKSLEELIKILEYYDNKNLKIYSDDKKIFLKIDNLWFCTSLLEGNYPQIQEFNLKNYPFVVHLNKDDVMKVLERISLFFSKEEVNKNIVLFKLTEEKIIEISISNENLGTALEKIIPLKVTSEKFEIAFNAKHLEDILKVLTSSEIVFYFESHLKPFIVTTLEEESSVHLIFPIQKEND